MIRLNIHEAKTHLSKCLEKLGAGEPIILCKRNVPVAEIRPIRQHRERKRPIGLAKGEFNPDYAVGIVTRVEKPQRNANLQRFCAEGILINMLRSKIVKGTLQQGFSGRSRWLLHNLGLN